MSDDLVMHYEITIQRWTPYAVDGGCDAYGQMEEDDLGGWVSFEEHTDRIEALTNEVARLTAERDRQYDENVHRIAEQAKAEARAEAAEAKLAQGVRVKPGYRVDAYDLTMGGKTVPLDRAIDAVPAAQIADDAIERCAQEADEAVVTSDMLVDAHGVEVARFIAANIRALKGTMK